MQADLSTPDLFAATRGYANAEPDPSVCPEPRPVRSGVGGASVLDACCGSRMFWFDRKDPRTLFVDKRREFAYRSKLTDRNHVTRAPESR